MVSIKLQSSFIKVTHRHGCSPLILQHIFRTPFSKNTSGWLLLEIGFKGFFSIESLYFRRNIALHLIFSEIFNIQGYLETNLKDLLRHNHIGIAFLECWHVEAHQIQHNSHLRSLSDCNIALLLEIPISKSHPGNEIQIIHVRIKYVKK